MKLTPLPLLATGAVALVLPDPIGVNRAQAPVSFPPQPQHQPKPHKEQSSSSWWDSVLPSSDSIAQAIDDSLDVFDAVNSGIDAVVHPVESIQQRFKDDLGTVVDAQGKGHHEFPDLTIYQLLQRSNYTKKFAAIVDEHPDVVKLLNSTGSSNYTLFAPVDAAFEDLPPDHPKPDKDFIEAALKYHIGLGEYRAHKILTTNTIPTAFDEKWLGGEPQRLRTSVGLSGVRVNFYSKVVAADIGAKNGVIHGIRNIVAPPPMIGRILTLFPSEFSTLLLAYEKTDFVKYIHHVKMTGSTVFAPSNRAFAALGPKANAFLFNTERGLKCLKALLKYHIAANATLYSDAFYDKTGDDEDDDAYAGEWKREHYDLKSLLDGAHVGVDVAFFAGLTAIKVNGFANVHVRDAPGKNGVVQVIDKVLIPPRKHRPHDSATAGDVSPEELLERLKGYIDESHETDESHPFDFEL